MRTDTVPAMRVEDAKATRTMHFWVVPGLPSKVGTVFAYSVGPVYCRKSNVNHVFLGLGAVIARLLETNVVHCRSSSV
jgi:hypothetical protein